MTQTRKSDADLKTAVVAELGWTPSVDSTHVGVAVNDGAVTLSGEVGSYPEKLLAATAAQRVRGVTAIAQEITVRTTWGRANDTDIAREAGEALERAIDVPDSVKATVNGTVVTLSGAVDWRYQRGAAERAVRYPKGVTDVTNLVTIRAAAMAAGVEAAITGALVRSARTETKHIRVTVGPDGLATIAGAVRSWAERREAEHACWAAPGRCGQLEHPRGRDARTIRTRTGSPAPS